MSGEHLRDLVARGLALQQSGRLGEAEALYRQVLEMEPRHVTALTMLGTLHAQRRNLAEAERLFGISLKMDPFQINALYNRGIVLAELKRFNEALVSYDRAIAQKPDNPVIFNNRGNALTDLCRHKEALESYDRALVLKPDYLEALFNRGVALSELKRYEDALASFERAIALQPDFPYAIPYAQGSIACARLHLCDWFSSEDTIDDAVERSLAGDKVLVPFDSYILRDSAALHYQCARTYARDKNPASPHLVWKGERYAHDRIRLAYVSFDFREHVLAHQFAGAIEHHDRARFEMTALSLHPGAPDAMQNRLRNAFERFVDVSNRSDLEAAKLIRELETDILIDLTGYTRGGRMGILAWRPAPIQVNFNCPGTTGADYVDYIVTDRIIVPLEHHPYYTEKVVYLPDTFQANDSQRRIAERTPSRSEAGLPEKGFVFCSFNNSYKFRSPVFDIWMRLLLKFEGSVLWLRSSNSTMVDNLRREAKARGVDPERLIFAPYVKRVEDHFARQRIADLFLDTLPYNAQTTASDALWAGLPVLTCLGGALPGRVAASVLTAVGLPELITHSLEEYEALATSLVQGPERLRRIRDKLASNRLTYPLFDTARFTRHLEAAYEQMARMHKQGEAPRHFSVTPLVGAAVETATGSIRQ
jgi:predicted O-linked N-acetylglucosamine transferase (SPINDLY family)